MSNNQIILDVSTYESLNDELIYLRKRVTELETLVNESQGIINKQKEQLEMYTQILEAVPDLILCKGPKSHIVYANKAFRNFYGMTLEELTNIIDASFNDPDYTQQYVIDDAYVFNSGQILDIPAEPVTRHDGEVHFFHTIKSPIFNTAGEVVKTVGISQDITEQQKLFEQTGKSERLLRTIIDSTPDWIFAKDKSFHYILTNKSFANAIGYESEEIIGKDDLELGFPSEQVFGNPNAGIRGFRTDDELVLQGNSIFNPFDPATFADGSLHIFDTQKIPLRDADGNVFAVLGFSRDITAHHQAQGALREQAQQLETALHSLKEAQFQLIQTEKMSSLGQLVAGVAHEINNPINFIFGNITHITNYTQDLLTLIALYQQYSSSNVIEIQYFIEKIELDFLIEDLPKTLSSMKIGAERIRQIVLSLRNFSRLDESDMKPVDIHEGIDNTLVILNNRLKAKADLPGILVSKEYSSLPLVECYAGQLNQVFMNILANAIEALESYNKHRPVNEIKINPPQITIKTLSSSESVTICISDNGPGMTPEVSKQVFNPFFTTKPVGEGTGLGLSISYQIVVEKHGGSLKCASAPGLGTQFWIEIPLKQTLHSLR